jgi:hypothetical protein
MSKKKQFSGKKTKLAKLPLTEALSRQLQEPPESPAAVVPEVVNHQAAFSWESLEEGAAGLLTAAYFLVVQDLLSLKNDVPWTSEETLSADDILPKTTPLPASQVKQALRQAKEDLSDLYRMLSG